MGARNRQGFTLIELVVVCLIIATLASFAVPQYLRTTETNRFDDAVATVNQIGTTNKMFALDHSGVYVQGAFNLPDCACKSNTCQNDTGNWGSPPPANDSNPCDLVCCNYLSDQNWSQKAYQFMACDPQSGSGGAACGGSCGGLPVIAAAIRAGGTPPAYSPYSTWAVAMNESGTICVSGTNPPKPTY